MHSLNGVIGAHIHRMLQTNYAPSPYSNARGYVNELDATIKEHAVIGCIKRNFFATCKLTLVKRWRVTSLSWPRPRLHSKKYNRSRITWPGITTRNIPDSNLTLLMIVTNCACAWHVLLDRTPRCYKFSGNIECTIPFTWRVRRRHLVQPVNKKLGRGMSTTFFSSFSSF